MNIQIRPVDDVKNFYVVTIDGVEMRLTCHGDPVQAVKELFKL